MKKSSLVRWHVYAGLFTFFYMMALGFSTLVLNHGVNLDKLTFVDEKQAHLPLEVIIEDDRALANSIRDRLNMTGWPLVWKLQKDEDYVSFPVTSPGKEIEIHYDFASSKASIKEYRKSFLSVLNSMHFFGGRLPNASLFIKSFSIYQYAGLIFLFISMILGVWLWLRYSYKKWEVYLFCGFTVFSIIIMVLI